MFFVLQQAGIGMDMKILSEFQYILNGAIISSVSGGISWHGGMFIKNWIMQGLDCCLRNGKFGK